MTYEVHPAIVAAEKKIRAVLLELANDHGLAIDSVCVDTRNFANFRTEIFEVAPRRQRTRAKA
jgi:gamma-glutamyl:cysteine ligase YbdK (ATP-grasp superfamily)